MTSLDHEKILHSDNDLKSRYEASQSNDALKIVHRSLIKTLGQYGASFVLETAFNTTFPARLSIVVLAGFVLISYSYFEKDAIQKANAEFFFKVGMGINSTFLRDKHSDFVVIVNGDDCR